jgi:hypothetical protein
VSDLSAFPEGLPWGEQQAFLLLDGATISDLPQRLKQLNPTDSRIALYDQTPFSALRDVSPLLVAISQPADPLAQFYLHNAQEEWGVLLFSAAPLHGVAEHLRKLISVELPSGPAVLLRLAQRWGVLDQLENQASALGLGGPSALFYYANFVFWLGSSEFDQHPQIHHLLHTPSLQSPGERVALAAALAHQWAAERGRS